MNQPNLENDLRLTSDTTSLRQRLRRALANDLQLPEKDPAITATMKALALVARQHASTATTRRPVTTHATLDSWWKIVAHTRALSSRH
jgi:hypothetical protein